MGGTGSNPRLGCAKKLAVPQPFGLSTASTVGDRGHKENAIAAIRDAIRDSRIATFANKLVCAC